ncbi:MAG: alpha/beta fold hydrolase [Anaerolineales bacterium]|nr:alpha/beta fold hydrolase [Anaerolineales bacterium]
MTALARIFLLACLLAGCTRQAPLPAPEVHAASTAIVFATTTLTPFEPAAEEPAPTAADPYAALSIPALAARSYGGGQLIDLGSLGSNPSFARRLISYPSDGLTINGFVDIPQGEGPFPVVLVLHGYVEPHQYQLETYTARYAAAFARAGFIAIHPNYRNYAPSDSGPNLFRVGYAVDVLNLIALVKAQAGQPGLLQAARPDALFLWGHSMGGGISLRVLAVGADVQGAVLYGSMSGDEQRNFAHIRDELSDGSRGLDELSVPEDILASISPAYFYERISAPVSIHHGDADAIVPPFWSRELCSQLQNLGKQVECYMYPNMPHTFYGQNDDLFMQRSIGFFRNLIP